MKIHMNPNAAQNKEEIKIINFFARYLQCMQRYKMYVI